MSTARLATRMANKKAEGMLAPLLSDEESSIDSDDSNASSKMETVKKGPLQKLKTFLGEELLFYCNIDKCFYIWVSTGLHLSSNLHGGIVRLLYIILGMPSKHSHIMYIILLHTAVYIGVSVGCAASVGAMVLSPAIAIFVMGGICIANAPYALFKERQMDKIPSLRAMNNKLREDANNLEDAVDDLSEEIDLLEPEADRAASVEEELRGIAEKQEVNVNKFVELVKENEVILAKMRVREYAVCFILYV